MPPPKILLGKQKCKKLSLAKKFIWISRNVSCCCPLQINPCLGFRHSCNLLMPLAENAVCVLKSVTLSPSQQLLCVAGLLHHCTSGSFPEAQLFWDYPFHQKMKMKTISKITLVFQNEAASFISLLVCTSKTSAHKYNEKIGGQPVHSIWEGSLHLSCHRAFTSWGREREERTRECSLGFLLDFVLYFQDIWKSCLKKTHSGYTFSSFVI